MHIGSIYQVTNGVSQAEPTQMVQLDELMYVDGGPGEAALFLLRLSLCICLLCKHTYALCTLLGRGGGNSKDTKTF